MCRSGERCRRRLLVVVILWGPWWFDGEELNVSSKIRRADFFGGAVSLALVFWFTPGLADLQVSACNIVGELGPGEGRQGREQ